MRIKMKTLAAGPNGVLSPGQEVEVAGDLARALIEGGYAEAVEKIWETAAAEPPEQAVSPKKVRKRRKSGESARRKA